MTTINVSALRSREVRGGPAAARRRVPFARRARRNATGYLFLAGAVLCFAVFSWWPIIREVIMSFQYTNFAGDTKWVGLENYRHIIADPDFWQAWRTTGLFTLFALVFGYAVPFVVAVTLNELRHMSAFFRLLVYLPVMMPTVAGAFLWKWFYNAGPDGFFNEVLAFFHVGNVQWLQSSHWLAVLCLVFYSTWANMGSGVLIYLAALQSVPGELYEAAELDGAGIVRRLWSVTVPQVKLILSLMLMLQIVATAQVFTEPYVITGGAENTTSVVYLIYQYAFNFNNYGNASALGIILMLVLMVFAGIYMRLARAVEED